MTLLTDALASLSRPTLLVRAARQGLAAYSRSRDLARLTGQSPARSPRSLVAALIDLEQQLEDERKSGDAAYRVSQHIDVLIALMAEGRLLARS